MGAIVRDGCIIERNSIIGAGSVVLEGTHVETGYIYAGNPARKIKKLDYKKSSNLISGIANNYLVYSSWFIDEC